MEKMRHLTRRTRSGKLEDIIKEINQYSRGWIAYYRLATTPSVYQGLDEWMRRRLRQMQWKRWKRGTTRYRELVRLGVLPERAALGAVGTSPWRMSRFSCIWQATPCATFPFWFRLVRVRSYLSLTQRATDKWDSAAFSSIFPWTIIRTGWLRVLSCSQAESTPSHRYPKGA